MRPPVPLTYSNDDQIYFSAFNVRDWLMAMLLVSRSGLVEENALYRKKKCTESQQLNSSMQDDPTEEIQNKEVKENNAERKRAMAKERSRRFREKESVNVLKSFHHVV